MHLDGKSSFEPAPTDPQSVMLARLHYGHHGPKEKGVILKRFLEIEFSMGKTKPPIYIIPGSLDFLMLYRKWKKYFGSRGYDVFIAPVGLETAKIQKSAERVRKDIIKKNLKGVVIVSASLGSVIAKYCLNKYPEINKRVGQIVAVCAPFKGTYLAWLTRFLPSYRQILPNSEFIKKLGKGSNKKIVSIRPFCDTEVIPLNSEIVKGGKNIQAKVTGHIFAPYTSEIMRLILREIR